MMQYSFNFQNEIIVDNFAGGGGASWGIEAAIHRPVDIAVNHNAIALKVHKLNHPHTKHFCEDVFSVSPEKVCNGRPVGLAWFSPDCRHFSKAKGGRPVEKKIRGLAWVARKWAKEVKPRIIILENVEEFLTWGPLKKVNGKLYPDKKRAGLTFAAFNKWFLKNGYKTDRRLLIACSYGAPTTRKRFFWIARCDGEQIKWPEATHGNIPRVKKGTKRKTKPYRNVSECIDWSIPCPSIFMSEEEAKQYKKDTGVRIKRPLSDATLKRIAKGIFKFILENQNPFILKEDYIASSPFIIRQFGQSVGSHIEKPVGSITAGGMGKTGLVSAFLAKHYTGVTGSSLKDPLGTITSIDHHSLVTAKLSKNKDCAERVAAFLIKYYGQGIGQKCSEPLHTMPTKDRFGLVTVFIKGEPWVICDIGIRMLQPEELKLAQGFPPEFQLGDIPKTDKVRLIGNSVPPQFAEAIVKANYSSFEEYREAI